MKIKEKEDAEGTLWREIWQTYITSTRSLWSKYPEVLAAGFGLTRPYSPLNGQDSDRKNWWVSFRKSISFVLHPLKNRSGLPRCDVTLFHSSSKPGAKGPITALAGRLVRRGYRCAVFSSSDMHIWEKDPSMPDGIKLTAVIDYKQRFSKGSGYLSSFRKVCRSAYITAVLLITIRQKAPSAFGDLFSNPLEILYQLLLSCQRLAAAGEMLKQFKPRVLITMHERLPIISEVLLSKEAADIPKILYHYEEPLIQSIPVLSKTVWVWNQTAENELIKFIKDDARPDISITGNYEIDQVLETSALQDAAAESELVYRRKIGEKPVLLYLSQYGQLGSGFVKSPAEAAAWLEYAAAHCPGWHFIIKPRPFHYDKAEPGAELTKKYDNVSISPEEIPMARLLMWTNVAIVASIYSTGLYVAAGAGRTAVRLLVPHRREALPLIDGVSTSINTPEDLVKLLNNFVWPQKGTALAGDVTNNEDPRFPYRGHTIDRIERLCLEQLNKTS
jgi:hypothetical protein